MAIDIYWRIPTHGDKGALRHQLTRGDWTPTQPGSIAPGLRGGEPDDFSYLDHMADIARAAEISGFYGALIPSFPNTEDPWIISSALARETKTLRFMIAFQPGFLNPVHAARMSASLQAGQWRASRLQHHQRRWWPGPALVGRQDRSRRPVSPDHRVPGRAQGRVERGSVHATTGRSTKSRTGASPSNWPSSRSRRSTSRVPPMPRSKQPVAIPTTTFRGWNRSTTSGSSSPRCASVPLSSGREARFAVRVDVLARPTEEEAWNEIRRGWEAFDASQLKVMYGSLRGGDSVGGQRQQALRSDEAKSYKDLIIAPNIWSGFSLLRGGPGLGIVGDYANAAERLSDLIELGVDAFILAGVPHLEEAYRVGEEVLPLVRGRQVAAATVGHRMSCARVARRKTH